MWWDRHSLFTAPGRQSPASCTAGVGSVSLAVAQRDERWLLLLVPAGQPCRVPSARGAGRVALLVFPPEDRRPSHLACFSVGSQSRWPVCYLPSAWWAPECFVTGCGVMKSLLSFAENLLKKSGTVMLKRAACCFTLINNANVVHTQSVCGCVWSRWLFCRFIKLCSCRYSCFDFRTSQCRLFTNWTRRRTIID